MSLRGIKYSLKRRQYFDIFEDLGELLYGNLISFFSDLKRRVEFFCYWGWKLKDSYDWDYCFLYEIIHIKMKRMHKNMTKYGHCVDSSVNSKSMKRLLEASELADRLRGKDNIETINMMKKYTHEGDFTKKYSHYGKRIELDEKTYRFFSKKAMERDASRNKTTKNRFFKLMHTYMENWWD